MEDMWKYVLVILTSSVKFFIAVPFARASGLSFIESLICCIIGGSIGVTAFLYLSDYIFRFLGWLKDIFFTPKKTDKPRRKFTKTNRFIVKVMRKYGLIGVAAITPILISIPVGTLVAERLNLKFFNDKPRLLMYLYLSVIGSSILLNTIFYLF